MNDPRIAILATLQAAIRTTAPTAVLYVQSHYGTDDLAYVDVRCVDDDLRPALRTQALMGLLAHGITVDLDTSRDVYDIRIM